MTAPRIDLPAPVSLRPATLEDSVAMWRAATPKILSPYAYATVIRRLPRRCACLVVEVDEEVIGFVVAHRLDDALHIVDLQLSTHERAARLFEVLHAVVAWPRFEGARVVEADESCVPEVRDAVKALSRSSHPPAHDRPVLVS